MIFLNLLTTLAVMISLTSSVLAAVALVALLLVIILLTNHRPSDQSIVLSDYWSLKRRIRSAPSSAALYEVEEEIDNFWHAHKHAGYTGELHSLVANRRVVLKAHRVK